MISRVKSSQSYSEQSNIIIEMGGYSEVIQIEKMSNGDQYEKNNILVVIKVVRGQELGEQ